MKWLKAHRAKILIIIAGALILFSINFFGRESLSPADRFKNAFYFISSPIQKILWGAGDSITDFFSAFFQGKSLQKENTELRLKNQETAVDNIEILALKKENEILRQALDIGLKKEFKTVFSQIIGKDIAQDFILLNKGLKHGILEGNAVITSQKVLCARISKAYQDFSRAELYSNKSISFDVEVLSQNSKNLTEPLDNTASAVVKGKGSLKIFLELLPREAGAKQGDFIFTASLSSIFPANLLVGEIKKIIKSDVEPFQKAEITPSCSITNAKQLFIVTEY